MKTTLFIILSMFAVSVTNAEEITWDSPPADYHYVYISEFNGFIGQQIVWVEAEPLLSEEKSVSVELEEGYYKITVQSCLDGVCMDHSEPVYVECVDYDTAFNIKINGE